MQRDHFRERSFLILVTRVEDNFAPLEKIVCPVLNMEKVFYPIIFQQNGLVSDSEVFVHKTFPWVPEPKNNFLSFKF